MTLPIPQCTRLAREAVGVVDDDHCLVESLAAALDEEMGQQLESEAVVVILECFHDLRSPLDRPLLCEVEGDGGALLQQQLHHGQRSGVAGVLQHGAVRRVEGTGEHAEATQQPPH
eukprot:scaffold123563_cov51-Phaeocystis_antarctica.AAC.7